MNVSIESVNRDLTTYKVSLAFIACPFKNTIHVALAQGTLAAYLHRFSPCCGLDHLHPLTCSGVQY